MVDDSKIKNTHTHTHTSLAYFKSLVRVYRENTFSSCRRINLFYLYSSDLYLFVKRFPFYHLSFFPSFCLNIFFNETTTTIKEATFFHTDTSVGRILFNNTNIFICFFASFWIFSIITDSIGFIYIWKKNLLNET